MRLKIRNVPVIITPVSENETDDDEIHSLNSEIYSIAIEAEHISVLKEGIILLQNVSSQVVDFEGKKVKVEFYFNKVGLYFITEMKTVSSGPALVIPNEINRIEDVYTDFDLLGKLFDVKDKAAQELKTNSKIFLFIVKCFLWCKYKHY